MSKHQADGLTYYTGDLLDQAGIKHGFFTRHGGVSPKPFDSLNLKRDLGDPVKNVLENRRRTCRALRLNDKQLVFAYLGHAAKVFTAGKDDAGLEVKGYDALVTAERDLPLELSVADCVPIIAASSAQPLIAIIHVSWRSLVAGIIPATFQQLQTNGMLAAVGPCIAAEHYEVKADVVDAVRKNLTFADKIIVRRGGKTYLDLRKASELQLQALGVEQIDHLPFDTFTHTDEFYSYRKEGKTGRFGAIVSL